MKTDINSENRISVYNNISEQLEKMMDREIEELIEDLGLTPFWSY